MCTASDVAKYFLTKSDPEIGDTISNLKLQKLLYLAQGFFLAIYDEPLFPENIEAWAHGPVVPVIYYRFKRFEGSSIPIHRLDFTKRARQLLDEIWSVYGQYSAWKLRDITHGHEPWKQTEKGKIIDNALMKDYFKTLLKA